MERASSRPSVVFADGDATIDARLVAQRFGLEPLDFLERLRKGEITSRFEKGVDEDAGTYRLTFFDENQRTRFVVNEAGEILTEGTVNFGSRPLPPGLRR